MYAEEEDEEDRVELKSEFLKDNDQLMLKFCGYFYAFRPESAILGEFYNKQMRIKYRSKTKKTLIILTGLIFLQEVLLWIGRATGSSEVNSIRVGFFAWIFLSTMYLWVSPKVYKLAVIMLICSKTILNVVELYLIRLGGYADENKFSVSYYSLFFRTQLDSIVFVSLGIFDVKEILTLNLALLVNFITHTLILQSDNLAANTLILSQVYFNVFSFFDTITHFDAEINAFFNYIRVEQRGYYLNTFVDRLLPKHIKDFSSSSTENYENATLLFADIVGFTEYSAGKNARQVVEMLSQLFTAFDKECNKLNLYKLYTIGDCYVVMSFLDKNNRKSPSEEANDMLQLAMFMIQTIQRVRMKINFPKLNMRIGLHTGKVVGGVIGTDIVRFDLYGPDVLAANKMESGGQPGRINLSETTKSLIDQIDSTNYTFEPNKEIEIKSVNKKYQSYFLIYNFDIASDNPEDQPADA